MQLALRDSTVVSSRSDALDDAKGRVSHTVVVVAVAVIVALVLGVRASPVRGDGDGLELVPINASPHDLTTVGDTLYFLADGRLWRSDGTESGTQRVADVTREATGWTLEGLTAAGDTLYFWARQLTEPADALGSEGEGRAELWRSDGTGAGTHLVKTILPEAVRLWVSAIVPAGDAVFVITDDGYRDTLWRSDGTAEGTRALVDLSGIGFVGGYGPSVAEFVVMANTAYFMVQDANLAYALGKSDGTADGSRRVAEIDKVVREVAVTGDTLFVVGEDGERDGRKLWTYEIPSAAA
ncbi:MAG: hypothetical protein ACRDJH_21575 [Thermomicrobiales bacterium]